MEDGLKPLTTIEQVIDQIAAAQREELEREIGELAAESERGRSLDGLWQDAPATAERVAVETRELACDGPFGNVVEDFSPDRWGIEDGLKSLTTIEQVIDRIGTAQRVEVGELDAGSATHTLRTRLQ
jgi:hypothetical protein